MKIALLGYGKMGQIIERIALERDHEIVLKKRSSDTFEGLEKADVAIEFSKPQAAKENIEKCLESNVAVVSGTTGWLEHYEEITESCRHKNGAFLYASNFSLGVNLFFELNDYLAKLMAGFKDYKPSIEEIHHTQKLDAPSGTAITLAEAVIAQTAYNSWSLDPASESDLLIHALREDQVPGTHTVTYNSPIDTISITHTAHNRNGFALGAVLAAEWIFGKKGVFSMKDVLHLKKQDI